MRLFSAPPKKGISKSIFAKAPLIGSVFVLFSIGWISYPQNSGLIADPKAEFELWRSFVRFRLELGLHQIDDNFGLSEWARYESRLRALEKEYRFSTPGTFTLEEASSAAGLYFKDLVVVKMEMPIIDISLFRDKLLAESYRNGQPLWQKTDIGGIGVTRSENISYVILALLESIRPLPLEQMRERISRQIDFERRAGKLKPISWKKIHRKRAQLAAENAALGKSIKYEPPSGMKAVLIKLETPDLILPEKLRTEYKMPSIRQAGLGVLFGRTRQYPGGRYLLSFLFLSKAEKE